MRPEIRGRMGIVAAGRFYAVGAGIRLLEAGGNAIDAGAAAVFAASVTEFDYFGFGGEAPALIYDAAAKKVIAINGQGPAPRAATPDLFKKNGYVDGNGPLGATVPAVLDSMALALQRSGSLRLEQVLRPAIEYADGFVVYGTLHDDMVKDQKATERWVWSKRTYYPNGRAPEVGEVFRQPYLAATLRRIVAAERRSYLRTGDRIAAIQAGRDEFYKGEIARKIAAAQREAGGVMTYDDLANYSGRIEEPLSVTFHDFRVFKCGPWDQGPVLLQTLNILEGIDLLGMGEDSADYLHTVTEAMKLAYADRDAYYGDPAFVPVPIHGLLSKDYAAVRRTLIGPRASLEQRPGDPYVFDGRVPRPRQVYKPHAQGRAYRPVGDTTSIQVVDHWGNLFSCTPSSGWLTGGAFVAGDTGIPMSNRMTVFDLDPLSPNVLAGESAPAPP